MPASSRNVSEGSLLADDRFLREVAQLYYEMEDTQEDIAKKLFDRGANMTDQNPQDEHKTALDYAKQRRHQDIVKLLEEKMK